MVAGPPLWKPRRRPISPPRAVPTLVLAGSYDWVCPLAASRPITDGIPGAELADAGHFGFAEEPARFHDAVRAFLGRLHQTASQPPASSAF